jgi:hypothetical protein
MYWKRVKRQLNTSQVFPEGVFLGYVGDVTTGQANEYNMAKVQFILSPT